MSDLITSTFAQAILCCCPCWRGDHRGSAHSDAKADHVDIDIGNHTNTDTNETDEEALRKAQEWRKRLSRRAEDVEAGKAAMAEERKRRSALPMGDDGDAAMTTRGVGYRHAPQIEMTPAAATAPVRPVSERWREAGDVVGVDAGESRGGIGKRTG